MRQGYWYQEGTRLNHFNYCGSHLYNELSKYEIKHLRRSLSLPPLIIINILVSSRIQSWRPAPSFPLASSTYIICHNTCQPVRLSLLIFFKIKFTNWDSLFFQCFCQPWRGNLQCSLLTIQHSLYTIKWQELQKQKWRRYGNLTTGFVGKPGLGWRRYITLQQKMDNA